LRWAGVREGGVEKNYEVTWGKLNAGVLRTFTSVISTPRILRLDSNTAYTIAIRPKNDFGRGEISEESTLFTRKYNQYFQYKRLIIITFSFALMNTVLHINLFNNFNSIVDNISFSFCEKNINLNNNILRATAAKSPIGGPKETGVFFYWLKVTS